MRTIKEYDPTDYYFLLKSVIDSRLLFSTKKHIAEHIGYSSLTSKPIKDIITRPFLAKSIFEGLSKEVDFMCDNIINLENLYYDISRSLTIFVATRTSNTLRTTKKIAHINICSISWT